MVTVEIDPVVVEQRLGSGGLACPDCAGRLAGWGRARTRVVRGLDGATVVTPRRSRCTRCRATHVLLPVLLLVRRADTAAVIGAALTARAAGAGHRRIAAGLGRPVDTVRGWLRRFTARVEAVREVFTGWCRALDPDPVLPGPAGTAWADALAAIAAAARAVHARFPCRRGCRSRPAGPGHRSLARHPPLPVPPPPRQRRWDSPADLLQLSQTC